MEQTERFCSTIATAHQEMTLRCEYLQQRIQALTGEKVSNATNNSIFQSKIHNDSLQSTFSSRRAPISSISSSMAKHRPPPPVPRSSL